MLFFYLKKLKNISVLILLCKMIQKHSIHAGHKLLNPAILAILKSDIRRMTVKYQTRQIVHEIPSQKCPTQRRAGGNGSCGKVLV
jgi:hypothetical protein